MNRKNVQRKISLCFLFQIENNRRFEVSKDNSDVFKQNNSGECYRLLAKQHNKPYYLVPRVT
jgi:hypothetical protein